MRVMMELKEDSRKSREENQKNMEALNKKLDDNSKTLKEDSQKNIELLKEDLHTKLDGISKKMEENNEKINTKIDREITVVRREIAEVHERCEQHSQDLQRTRAVSYTHLDVYKRQDTRLSIILKAVFIRSTGIKT